jgi:pimeloyl-ACP methyl ester carboxylesterase
MTSVQVAGMMINSEGGGPPIVMLHGLGGTPNSFQTMLSELVGFRVLRPDLPGGGRLRTPPRAIAAELRVETVENATPHLGVGRHVVGHSFGTLIARHLAACHPARPDSHRHRRRGRGWPPSVAQELADKIGNAKAVVLHRCGHWTPIEKSKECGKLLSEFVRGIPI